ncbi:TolC family protein [bacterium]|nr:TolC family protein [bacterium]
MKFKRIISFIIVLLMFYSPICSFAIDEAEKTEEVETIDVSDSIQLEEPKEENTLVTSINFDDIINKADEHSYDLKIADFNILISKQDIRGARSDYFPKLNVGAGTEYTKNYRDVRETSVMSIGEAFINPYTRYQNMLGITLNYNLFDFGVRRGRLDIAKEDVKLKELEEQEKLQELNLSVLDTYSKILVAKKQIELNKQILELEEKNLEMRKRLFNAKEISKTEYNDSEVKVARTKSKISELYSILSESINMLTFYTGEEYDIETLTVSDIPKPDFDIMQFKDYTKSITWQIHEKNLKKKELEVKIAKRNYLPKVNAYGRYYMYGSDHSSYPDSFKDVDPSNFTVGGSINMPVFDGFQNSAVVRKAELEYKQLQVERDKAIAQLMQRLATMRSNLMYLDDQIDATNKVIDELKDKNKSIAKMASKRVISPIEENESKIELLEQTIEQQKNLITSIAITKGIQILTDY